MGLTQIWAASTFPPSLKAMSAISYITEFSRAFYRDNNVLELEWILRYLNALSRAFLKCFFCEFFPGNILEKKGILNAFEDHISKPFIKPFYDFLLRKGTELVGLGHVADFLVYLHEPNMEYFSQIPTTV